jgi:type I restriction enzyme S subunit
MSSEWRNTTLGAICDMQGGAIQTGPFGSQLHTSDYKEVGVPVVMPTNIGDSGIVEDGIARIGQSDVDRLSQHVLRLGDIVFSRRGDVTKNALIRNREVGWFCGTGCLKVRLGNESIACAKFISHCLRLPDTKDWLVRHAVGATMPNLNTGILAAVPIHLPPLKYQYEMAGILDALDDRIALLRETNATLEAIAQALFKSWFVDFDPVYAKQQGIAPAGMDDATAALFPDGFEESALGVVPKGWHLMPFSDVFEINPSRTLRKGQIAPYLEMAGVATSGHRTDVPILREMGSGAKFKNGDTLLARITPCLENGKAAFVDFLDDAQVGWGSTEFLVLRPKGELPDYFAYLLCKHTPFLDFAIQSMVGTSGRQRIQNDALGQFPVAVPSDAIAHAFGDVVTAAQKAIASNHEQAQTLATLRDTLLPRLISGQLRLPEAEDALAEAIA